MNDKRKIIQIAATCETGTASDLLYALADDGTLWWLAPQLSGREWIQVQPLPQDHS